MRADFRRHANSKYLSKRIFAPASLRDLMFCVFWVAFISLSSTALADAVSEQPVKKDPITQDSFDRGGCETQKIRCDDQNKERSQTTDKPSFASLTIELAATYKTLGDQHYLEDKNRTDASDAYCKADQYSHEIDKASAESTLGDADRALLQLLRADIAYRKQLLRSGASFWGLEGAVPGNPLKQLAAFRLGFETYDKSVQQITDSLRASRSIHVEQAQIASHEIEQRLSKFVQEQKESIGNIQVSRYGETLSNARARQGYVRQEIDRIEKQADSLATQASNLNAQIGKTIVDALASSAGVPPGMVSALQKGDMTQVVKDAALKALNDPELLKNPAVASALSDLSTRAPDLSNMMRQVSDARDAVEKLKSQAAAIRYGIDTVGQFQRDPSFENLITLGNAAWNKLPASEQQALRQGVERFKPVGTLVQLASQANAVGGRLDEEVQAARNSVAQALAEVDNNGKLLAAQVIAFSDAMAKQGDWQQVTQFYKQMFNQTIARTPLTAENSRRLLLELVAIAPEAFANWLEQSKPAAFATLLKTNRLNDRADLVARLREDGFASISGLQVRTVSAKGTGLEAVYIISDGRAQPVGDVPNAFAAIISQFPAAGDVAQLTKSLETIYTVVASQGIVARKHLTLALLETAPTVVQRLVNEATLLAENSERSAKKTADQFRDALWAKAYSSLPGKVKEQTIEAAAKVVAGNGLANAAIDNQDSATTVLARVISNPAAPTPALAPNTDHQAASVNDAALRAMATMALDAACPGAGVAVGVISNMIALNGMWDKLNELFDDEKRLLAEERQLITTIQTAEIDKVIAEKERAVASASVEAAQAQIALWQQASDQTAADGDMERAIIRARRPLIFFTGEELRRHFDLFNRAMTMWTGIGQQGRPFLESYIKDNPQYVRFAVDHDIQLYGWLNRERDGARIDLDLVARRWQQKLALLEAVCSDSTMGCVPGLGRAHELSQNKAYLSGLMTSTQRRAFAGLLSRRNGAGEYQLVFTPTEAPLLAQDRNVRLLDIRMNWVDALGVALPDVVHGVTLNHPGFAALVGAGPDGVSLRQEILAPQQQSAFEPGPFSNLQASFDGFKGLSDSQLAMASTPRFYGYSPITTWNLRVDGAAIPRGAADLSIHIAYVFSRDNALGSESNFVELLKQRVPQSAVSGLADYQKKIWMEFPVSWYRFTSVKQTARDPSTEKWVTPISGPLTTRDIFLRPGMSPIQFKPNSENLSTDGYCLGESAITHARPAIAGAEPAEKVNAIAAVCLPREVIAQELGSYLRTRARDPQSQKPLSPEQAHAEIGTLMQSMDASGFCDCPAPRPQGALCKVQSSL